MVGKKQFCLAAVMEEVQLTGRIERLGEAQRPLVKLMEFTAVGTRLLPFTNLLHPT